MGDWVRTSERLPDKEKLVEVKATLFSNDIGWAILVDTAWGTTEWLYAGIINMEIGMVTEWRYPHE